jgi:hypothetical protein
MLTLSSALVYVNVVDMMLVPLGRESPRMWRRQLTRTDVMLDNRLVRVQLVAANWYCDIDGARRLGVRVLRATGTGTSALRRQWLAEPQVVAAGVADGGVTDAVGLVDGLLEDLRPGGTQRLEGLV